MTNVAQLVILVIAAVACGYAWTLIFQRLRRGEAAVPYESRRPVPWEALTVVTAGLIYTAVRAAVMLAYRFHLLRDDAMRAALEQAGDTPAVWSVPGYPAIIFQAAAVSNILAGAILLTLLIAKSRADPDDLGLSPRRIGYDLRLGVVAFFALAVPAVLLQAILTHLIQPSQHPILIALRAGGDAEMIRWVVVAAVVIAPAVEEFVFRGVLQGWLERLVGDAGSLTYLPIWASSLLFAAVHYESGIDVVSLFVLALGLGYLYRQTHRLWPGIVVHTLLNAFSVTAAILGAATE